MNAYFVENPQRVLGEPVVGDGRYSSVTLTVRNEDLRGVDTENPSGALGLYERMGYESTQRSIVFDLPLKVAVH